MALSAFDAVAGLLPENLLAAVGNAYALGKGLFHDWPENGMNGTAALFQGKYSEAAGNAAEVTLGFGGAASYYGKIQVASAKAPYAAAGVFGIKFYENYGAYMGRPKGVRLQML